jgi:hypothetical protein
MLHLGHSEIEPAAKYCLLSPGKQAVKAAHANFLKF